MNSKNENGSEKLDSRVAPYTSPTPGEITIMAISPWAAQELINDKPTLIPPTSAQFKSVADCGFNAVRISSSDDNYATLAFQFAKQYNLAAIWTPYKYLGVNESIYQIQKVTKAGYPVAAMQLYDEPYYADLQVGGKAYELFKFLPPLYPQYMMFFNLAYSYNEDYLGAALKGDYYGYLQWMEKTFNPSLWSYDYYPITTKNGSTYVEDKFYPALRDYSQISKFTGKPFWAYCLCTEFRNILNNTAKPFPTVGHLKFEAFTALAYGAQGIVFWHYANRLPSGSEVYDFSPLMVTYNNGSYRTEKTQIWYNVQEVIGLIKKYSFVFYGAAVRDVLEAQSIDLNGLPISKVVALGDGVIISHLVNGSYNYIVIVSKDPFADQDVKITLDGSYTRQTLLKLITEDKNLQQTKASNEDTIAQATLEPGGFIIWQY